jgi:dipeptidase E
MNIVAIGGGPFGPEGNFLIDKLVVELAKKPNPRALFIPTASSDSEDYIERFTAGYGVFGCDIDILRVHAPDATVEKFESQIQKADLVYVGGGNTKMMLAKWREFEIPRMLRDFGESGRPLAGLSAGALCWFRVGNSDWPVYEQLQGQETARLDCLGFVDLVLCPHTLDEGFRLDQFRTMMKGEHGVGVGLDDGCAIQIRDDQFRIVAAHVDRKAHRIYWHQGQLYEDDLEPYPEFAPIKALHTWSTLSRRIG